MCSQRPLALVPTGPALVPNPRKPLDECCGAADTSSDFEAEDYRQSAAPGTCVVCVWLPVGAKARHGGGTRPRLTIAPDRAYQRGVDVQVPQGSACRDPSSGLAVDACCSTLKLSGFAHALWFLELYFLDPKLEDCTPNCHRCPLSFFRL